MKGYHDSKTPESIRDLWRTPKEVFDYYNNRFNFGCDLAASIDNHLCDNFYHVGNSALDADPDDDLLKSANAVWCNPPYSNIMPWVNKCIFLSNFTGKPFVMLLPSDTSVGWFAQAFVHCTECHLISGRLSFINEETGKPVAGNNKGSVVFVFDPNSPFKSQTVLLSRDEIMGK